MNLSELCSEFHIVPLYNKKEDGYWTDWKENRHFKENAYSFACVFHSDSLKHELEIQAIVKASENDAMWLMNHINVTRMEKKELSNKTPKYLKDLFEEQHAPQCMDEISQISAYDSETGEFYPSLYAYRSFSPVAADLYRFVLYFQDSTLDKIAYKIMNSPQDYNQWDNEVRMIVEWFEQNDGKYIEKIKHQIVSHPKGNKAFPCLMGEIAKFIETRSSNQ